MAHVFISYAREDQDFVRRLSDALEGDEREVWVDWEGIPPSAEWFATIQRAVDAADACVFVLSPAFSASTVCADEVDYAASNNKRLIPIVAEQPGDDAAVAEALRELNWIFFRAGDAFDESYATLVEALDQDLDFVRQHARLLTRALEWAGVEDDSLLLRGSDLQGSLSWLAEAAAGKEPKPTGAHTRYIEASQAWEAAEVERWQELYGRALSRQLAVQAADEPDRRVGLLLAVEAVAKQPTIEARRTLLELLLETNDVIETAWAGSSIADLALRADGRLLAAALEGGVVALWELGGDGLRRLRSWASGAGEISSLAFDPAGERLAGCGPGGFVAVWDAATGEVAARFDLGTDDDAMSLGYSPDGATLAVGAGAFVRLVDVATGELRLAPLEHQGSVISLAYGPDGATLAVGAGFALNVFGTPPANWVYLWDPATGERRAELAGHTGMIHGLAFSPDGALLLSGALDGRLLMWELPDPASREEPPPSPGVHGGVTAAQFSPDGTLLATAGADHAVRVWDLPDGDSRDPLLLHRQAAIDVAFDPGAATVVSASLDGSLVRWDVRGGEPMGRPLAGHESAVAAVAFHPGGSQLASGDLGGGVRLWDPATRQATGTLDGHRDAVWSLAYSPDGKLLATASFDETLRLWDPAIGEPHGDPYEVGSPFIGNVAFGPDGARLACIGGAALPSQGDSEVVVWHLGGGEPRRFTAPGRGKLAAVAFGPDGRMLVAGTWNGEVLAWDLAAADPSPELLYDQGEAVMALRFSPDGALLASGGGAWVGQGDNHVVLWDVSRREPRFGPLAAHETTVSSLSFSGDGAMLASGGGSVHGGAGRPGIILWDVATGVAVSPLLVGHADSVMSVAFDPTAPQLASGGKDGVVRLWDLDVDHWLALARRKAGRALTDAEWRRYLPDEPRPDAR